MFKVLASQTAFFKNTFSALGFSVNQLKILLTPQQQTVGQMTGLILHWIESPEHLALPFPTSLPLLH